MATKSRKPADFDSISLQFSSSSKLGQVVRLMQRNKGASISELVGLTGWQAHSVRGAISGQLRKRCGLEVTVAEDATRGRVYRLKPSSGGSK